MDGVTIDSLLAEIEGLRGRHVQRVRLGSPTSLVVEIAGEREQRLWLEAGRGVAGVYAVRREQLPRLEDEPGGSGRPHHAYLRLRKALSGARLVGARRIRGERTIILTTGAGELVLRLSGAAPALTLVEDGRPTASLGEGPAAFPPPEPAESREWSQIDPADFAARVEEARLSGRSLARACLAACPALGPTLAGALDGSAAAFTSLRERLGQARPHLRLPRPLEDCDDRALTEPGAVALSPLPLDPTRGIWLERPSWAEAGALFLELRRRGQRFERRRRDALQSTEALSARVARLVAHLEQDLAGLPRTDALRHQAEALLASPMAEVTAKDTVELPDPYDPGVLIRIALDPRLSVPQNADRLFVKARRIEGARRRVEERLAEAQAALAQAERAEGSIRAARRLEELPVPHAPAAAPPEAEAAPRRYLSSRGIEILVGRSARENQRVTFEIASGDDLWFHASDVPGAHVVLRDREGRATAEDRREAAEVAAFFSDLRTSGRADVRMTPRKFVHAVRGSPGRVRVVHSEMLHVRPADPEGRLRRR